MTIGVRIKEAREKMGLSQVELADKIGVSKQTLYKYENNIVTNIPSDKIELAAKVCCCSPGYLMGWEDAAATPDSSDLMEKTLVTNYRKLSDDGKKDLVKRSDELVQLESLRKESRLGKDA